MTKSLLIFNDYEHRNASAVNESLFLDLKTEKVPNRYPEKTMLTLY